MAIYATADIGTTLRAAREAKVLSQRALARLAGLPQSHISKIENGIVDLRASGLMDLARVLDLDLVLIPRRSVPAVVAVVGAMNHTGLVPRGETRIATNELRQVRRLLADVVPKYPASLEVAQLGRYIRDLEHLPIERIDPAVLKRVRTVLEDAGRVGDFRPMRAALAGLQAMRDEIVSSVALVRAQKAARPAYALDEDEDEND